MWTDRVMFPIEDRKRAMSVFRHPPPLSWGSGGSKLTA
jgi:hypothetical protein